MAYRIEKKVGNSVYLYEVTSYWDPQKKQARQTRTYLGKKDPLTGEVSRPRSRLPRQAKDYGNAYLIQQVAQQLGLTAILQRVFPEHAATLLALVVFEISEAVPLYLFAPWAENTYLDQVSPLRPSELTTFTQHLGQLDRAREEFFCQWAKHRSPVKTIVFDITSLSSYATLLSEVEWGYNRDHEQLPQVNLGIVYAEQERLPLYYQLYPGSIRDVSTLPNIVEYLDALGLSPDLFVMDRGFYSATNLATMAQHALHFLMPLPRTVKRFSELIAQHHDALNALPKSFLFQDTIFCHIQTTTTIKALPVFAHLYCDPAQHQQQSLRFLRQLWEAETQVRTGTFQQPGEARQALTTLVPGAAKFFKVSKNRTGEVVLRRNTAALTERMTSLGTTIFLTNHADLDRARILSAYRQKDFLEKTFDTLKHEFDGKRLRAHSADAVIGRIFLKFLSLIVYAGITNVMREQHLFSRYSVREMLYELKKLRLVEMNNGKQLLTECSKRQKDIFTMFKVKVPTLNAS